jgi:hypothetical protein
MRKRPVRNRVLGGLGLALGLSLLYLTGVFGVLRLGTLGPLEVRLNYSAEFLLLFLGWLLAAAGLFYLVRG